MPENFQLFACQNVFLLFLVGRQPGRIGGCERRERSPSTFTQWLQGKVTIIMPECKYCTAYIPLSVRKHENR